MTDQHREAVALAVAVVTAKVRGDEEGAAALLDHLDASETAVLAGTLAGILAWLGPEASGGPEPFLGALARLRERF